LSADSSRKETVILPPRSRFHGWRQQALNTRHDDTIQGVGLRAAFVQGDLLYLLAFGGAQTQTD
jgi:hypothetical protein